MRRVAGALLLSLGAAAMMACVNTSLKQVPAAGAGPAQARGKVVLAGHLRVVPKVAQHQEGGPNAILLGNLSGNFYAAFTRSMRAPWSRTEWPPTPNADSAWLPLEGPFFLEVPAGRTIYLRGLTAMTNMGRTDLEVPLRIDVRPGDEVIYVGHWHFIRTPPTKILVKDRLERSQRAAKQSGRHGLLQRRWVRRLAVPITEDGESLEARLVPVLPSATCLGAGDEAPHG